MTASPGGPRDTGQWPLVRDGLAVVSIAVGVLAAVVVFLPAEGRVAAPLHDLLGLLLGRATFVVPITLLLAGCLTLLHSCMPDLPLPWTRLFGVALIAIAALPAQHMLGIAPGDSLARAFAQEGAGLVGHSLGSTLLDWLGGPATVVVLLAVLILGTLLAFDVTVAEAGSAAAAGARAIATRWPRPRAPQKRAAQLPARAPQPLPATPRPALAAADAPAVSPLIVRPPRAPLPETTAAQSAVQAPASEETNAPAPEVPQLPVQVDEWTVPTVDLFRASAVSEADTADLATRSRLIEETLATFGIEGRVITANHGPSVTQFEIEPAAGVAVTRILARQDDLALRLGSSPIRMEAPVPGKNVVGLEVPNPSVTTVTLRDVLDSPEWSTSEATLRVALGRDVGGRAVVADLTRMPHLLIAGATGSGKSVCINTLLGSLLFQLTPDDLQLVLIDPKRVELGGLADIPHLRLPIVTDMDRVVGVLKWLVLEMDRRYKLFAQRAARDLDSYNRRLPEASIADEPRLPRLVVVIDELADMMMTAADEVEKALCRLAQLARATGIHLVVATQRPSVDVVTGLIKANFPTRIAFAVASQTDSRVILDQPGADKLLGRGDALFMPTDAMKPIRLQAAFVADAEIHDLVRHWKAQGPPRYSADDLAHLAALSDDAEDDADVYDRAVELAETVGRVSVSLLQRRLGLGHDDAERLLARLIEEGIADA